MALAPAALVLSLLGVAAVCFYCSYRLFLRCSVPPGDLENGSAQIEIDFTKLIPAVCFFLAAALLAYRGSLAIPRTPDLWINAPALAGSPAGIVKGQAAARQENKAGAGDSRTR